MSDTKKRFWAAIGIGSVLTIFFFGINSMVVDAFRGWATVGCGLVILALGFKLALLKRTKGISSKASNGKKDMRAAPNVTVTPVPKRAV